MLNPVALSPMNTSKFKGGFFMARKTAQRGVGPALLAVLLCLHKPIPKETKCKTNTLFGMPFDETADDGKKLCDRFVLADEAIHFPFCARHRA